MNYIGVIDLSGYEYHIIKKDDEYMAVYIDSDIVFIKELHRADTLEELYKIINFKPYEEEKENE